MIFYNPYLRLEENNIPKEIFPKDDFRKAWHNKIREEAYKNVSMQAEIVLGRRLRFENFEEKYFL